MTRAGVAVAVLVLLVLVLAPPGNAHKGVTSKYTYNADVYPVLERRCGRCHIDGGVGPMSLLKYQDAFPWAESLRAELLSATGGDPHDFVKAAHRQILARELDIVLDWATGGTPEGDKAQTPPPATLKNEWTAGTPALTLTMHTPFHMPAGTFEIAHEVALPVPAATPHAVAALDVLPGNPAIVRSAAMLLRAPDGTTRMLGTWVPRQTPALIHLKPPVRIESGSEIVARFHYKKTWKFEGEPMIDQSAIGLYFTD
jgi:hypothetical protein